MPSVPTPKYARFYPKPYHYLPMKFKHTPPYLGRKETLVKPKPRMQGWDTWGTCTNVPQVF